MDSKETTIKVETIINVPIEKVWEYWTEPEHITHWNFSSDEWICPSAMNDLRPGGKFNWRMEAKDGSMGFDFTGSYVEIIQHKSIKYALDDGRKTEITFSSNGESTQIIETFEADVSHSVEMQQAGWQAILNNFKKYAESKAL
jgi:uncharacterized protein YndB with AHSA1/START domain